MTTIVPSTVKQRWSGGGGATFFDVQGADSL